MPAALHLLAWRSRCCYHLLAKGWPRPRMAEAQESDLDLMLLVRGGRRDAFARIVERHAARLVRLFRRLGADAHVAEDCAQEVFLRVWRARARYRPTAPVGAFLCRIARNVWIDWSRRSALRRSEPMAAIEGVPAGEDGGSPSRDDRLDLRATLERLPDHLRAVVLLSVDDGLSYAEIAEALGIPLGTVKSRMFHAVRALREVLHARSR